MTLPRNVTNAELNQRVNGFGEVMDQMSSSVSGMGERIENIEGVVNGIRESCDGISSEQTNHVAYSEQLNTNLNALGERVGVVEGQITELRNKSFGNLLKKGYEFLSKHKVKTFVGGVAIGGILGLSCFSFRGDENSYRLNSEGVSVNYVEGENHSVKLDNGHYKITLENSEGTKEDISTIVDSNGFSDNVERIVVEKPGRRQVFESGKLFKGYGVKQKDFFDSANRAYNCARRGVWSNESANLSEIVDFMKKFGKK